MSNRYIVEITERHPDFQAKFGKWVANLSTGRGTTASERANRKFICDSSRSFEKRIKELEEAEIQWDVKYFESYLDAVKYVWDTTEYLNDGIQNDKMGFGLKYGYSFK